MSLVASVLASAAHAAPVAVTPDLPALDVPSTALMSREGNESRVEHIMTERSLSGRPTAVIAEFFPDRLR